MRFEWDSKKAATNIAKHGVTFDEATTSFSDPDALVGVDEEHSGRTELRFYLFGKSVKGRILTVRYTHRGARIRIIGAGAWKDGKKIYESNR